MTDYIIVGCGLAGIAFAEMALKDNKSIIIYDNSSQSSSKIAGGLYNPVILKRFSAVWQAQEQLVLMNEFYLNIEKKLNVTVDFKIPILRKFFSIEEQNNWFSASDKQVLAPFLSTVLVKTKYSGIDSPYNYGQVLQSGYVDTALLLVKYKEYLVSNSLLLEEAFLYDSLKLTASGVQYKGLEAKHIVFAEGFGMHSNPHFATLPLDGTKGELFIIEAKELNLDVIVNTSVFILPLGNHLFKVGATYNWRDKTSMPSEEGKQELIDRIKEIITCDFEIKHHFAGVRPTVKDRRPLVGTHIDHQAIHILNGLGTRGVMLGPAMAKSLYEWIEMKKPIDPTVDINRFYKKMK
ncbi:MAG: glycine oxidase [Flavobacteriales bacterium]|jgi:glycine oxidase